MSADTGAMAAIKVLTLNTHQGFGAHRRRSALLRIRDALRNADSDLVFLQEVGVAHGSEAPLEQYEVLADSVWPQHAYGRNAVKTRGHHGNAVLSKYPIISSENVDASVGTSEPRGLLHCVLRVPGTTIPLHAVCVHLALRESHRVQQVGRLLDLVADRIPHGAPIVIAGDFNDWQERAHLKMLRNGIFEEVNASMNGRPARTYPARLPMLRLDRIYVRGLGHRPLERAASSVGGAVRPRAARGRGCR